jgi:hypothetical protein
VYSIQKQNRKRHKNRKEKEKKKKGNKTKRNRYEKRIRKRCFYLERFFIKKRSLNAVFTLDVSTPGVTNPPWVALHYPFTVIEESVTKKK